MSEPTIKIFINKGASARVECEKAEIIMPNGEVIIKEGRFSLCRCGKTKKQPFCDGSHKECDFDS